MGQIRPPSLAVGGSFAVNLFIIFAGFDSELGQVTGLNLLDEVFAGHPGRIVIWPVVGVRQEAEMLVEKILKLVVHYEARVERAEHVALLDPQVLEIR